MSAEEQEAGRLRIVPFTVDPTTGKFTRFLVVAPKGFQWDNTDHALVATTHEEAKQMAVRERLSPCPNDCSCREED